MRDLDDITDSIERIMGPSMSGFTLCGLSSLLPALRIEGTIGAAQLDAVVALLQELRAALRNYVWDNGKGEWVRASPEGAG